MLNNNYFRFTRFVFSLIICSLVLSACSSFQAVSERTYPAVWQVHSENPNAGNIWLFGTIHALPYGKGIARFNGRSNYRRRFSYPTWLSPIARNALRASDVILLEIVEPSTPRSNNTDVDISGQTLLDNLDDASKQRIIALAQARGFKHEEIDTLSAADLLVAFSLFSKQNRKLLDQPGVENWLRVFARESRLQLNGLESSEDRITAITETFKQISSTDHERVITEYFNIALSETSNKEVDLQALYQRWISGDSILTEKQSVALARDYPEIYAAFITYRNKLWIPRIQEYINSGKNVFIAVGEAHLNGPDNVRELLETAGYKVQRL